MTERKRPRVRETVSLYEAKTNLSSLVERAAAGEESSPMLASILA